MTENTLNRTSLLDKFIDDSIGEMDIAGYIVPSINAPVIMLDELKGKMLANNPPFAVMYCDQPEGRMFVLFSFEGDERVNLKEIVKPYRGVGDSDLATFRAPPQKDMAGEFIPLALEFPPDKLEVLGLYVNADATWTVHNMYHKRDGKFKGRTKPVAWCYMPELSDSINGVHH